MLLPPPGGGGVGIDDARDAAALDCFASWAACGVTYLELSDARAPLRDALLARAALPPAAVAATAAATDDDTAAAAVMATLDDARCAAASRAAAALRACVQCSLELGEALEVRSDERPHFYARGASVTRMVSFNCPLSTQRAPTAPQLAVIRARESRVCLCAWQSRK